MRTGYLIAIVSVVAFLAMVIWPMGSYSFDEVFSIELALHSFSDFWRLAVLENNPPFFYFLLFLWVRIVGTGEFAVRLLGMCAGIASVVGLFFLTKELFSKKVAFFAGLIAAVSPLWIFFGREARMYPFMVAFLLWAMYFSWRLVATGERKYAIWYVIFCALAMLTHLGAWLVIGAHFLIMLMFVKKSKLVTFKKWILLHVPHMLIGILYLVIFIAGHKEIPGGVSGHWLFAFSETNISRMMQSGLLTTMAQFGAWDLLIQIVLWVLMLAFVLRYFIKSTVIAPQEQKENERALWALLLLFSTMIIAVVAHVSVIRVLAGALALLPLLLSFGIMRLSRHKPVIQIGSVVAVCVALFAVNIKTIPLSEIIDWKEMTKQIEKRAEPGDTILVHQFNEALAYNWYAQKSQAVGILPGVDAPEFRDIILQNAKSNVTEETVSYTAQYIGKSKRVFFVNSHGVDTFWGGGIVLDWFRQEGWREVNHASFSHFEGIGVVYEFTKE